MGDAYTRGAHSSHHVPQHRRSSREADVCGVEKKRRRNSSLQETDWTNCGRSSGKSSRAKIFPNFFRSWSNRFLGEKNSFSVFFPLRKRLLHETIFDAVERDDCYAPLGRKHLPCCVQSFFERTQFIVHCNAKCLECTRCWMQT